MQDLHAQFSFPQPVSDSRITPQALERLVPGDGDLVQGPPQLTQPRMLCSSWFLSAKWHRISRGPGSHCVESSCRQRAHDRAIPVGQADRAIREIPGDIIQNCSLSGCACRRAASPFGNEPQPRVFTDIPAPGRSMVLPLFYTTSPALMQGDSHWRKPDGTGRLSGSCDLRCICCWFHLWPAELLAWRTGLEKPRGSRLFPAGQADML